MLLDRHLIKVQTESSKDGSALSSTSVKDGTANLSISLPATQLTNVSVVPKIEIFRTLHPEISPIYKTVLGDVAPLSKTAKTVLLPLPTDSEGVFYGKIQLYDSLTSLISVSNPVEFSYQIGVRHASIEGLAVQSTKQFGPFTQVKGVAVINFNEVNGDSPLNVTFKVKDMHNNVIKTETTATTGITGVNTLPFNFLLFGAFNSNNYTISAELADKSAISGTLPPKSGTVSFLIAILIFMLLSLFGARVVSKKIHSSRLVPIAAVIFAAVLFQALSAPKAFAADDYGRTNTTFSPGDGTNMGNFPACGQPDGSNYSNNDACKIRISGSLVFDANYLENANGGYSDLQYNYEYLEYQVYVNGVLVSDPFDPDSQRIALSSSGNTSGNDLFTLTLTPHFTGQYQIKLIPHYHYHYHYYFNSCHGLFNDNCSHEWWLSDSALFTATVVANVPTLSLPAAVLNPAGASSVPLNYLSSGLSNFTLTDSSGAAQYPKVISIGGAGNLSLVSSTSNVPVTATPIQTLTATAQSVSNAPDASSSQKLVDPIPVRQGDYYSWHFDYPRAGIPILRDGPFVHLTHSPTLYPGDAPDYSRQYALKRYSPPCTYNPKVGACNSFINSSGFTDTDLIIPVLRYGDVPGIDPAARDLTCTFLREPKFFALGKGGSYVTGYTDGLSTCTGTDPNFNSGDSYAPEASTLHDSALSLFNGGSSDPSCVASSSGYWGYQSYTCSYTRHAEILRNYAGKTRYLFPIDAVNHPVTGTTEIKTGTTSGTLPTVTLKGPTSVNGGDSISLNLSISSFIAQSSGIAIDTSVIDPSCVSLGANGGSCTVAQTPSTTTTYTYQGWACDGLNHTGSCLSSNTVSVSVLSGSGGSGGSGSGTLSYLLSGPTSAINSTSTFTLTAEPKGTISATSVLFKCFDTDSYTNHSGTMDTLTTFFTYKCTAPSNTGSSSLTINTQAHAIASSAEADTNLLSVTVLPNAVLAVPTGRFCTGD